jgi:hypothetical protein
MTSGRKGKESGGLRAAKLAAKASTEVAQHVSSVMTLGQIVVIASEAKQSISVAK